MGDRSYEDVGRTGLFEHRAVEQAAAQRRRELLRHPLTLDAGGVDHVSARYSLHDGAAVDDGVAAVPDEGGDRVRQLQARAMSTLKVAAKESRIECTA